MKLIQTKVMKKCHAVGFAAYKTVRYSWWDNDITMFYTRLDYMVRDETRRQVELDT